MWPLGNLEEVKRMSLKKGGPNMKNYFEKPHNDSSCNLMFPPIKVTIAKLAL